MNFEIIDKIKGIEINLNGMHFDVIPCKCITNKDEVIDFCLIVKNNYKIEEVEKYFEKYFSKPISINDIKEIQESDFALPYNIRLATTKADEVRMDFFPTQVESQDGKFYILNGITHFLKDGDRMGKDCKLIEELKYESEVDEYYDKRKDKITYVLMNQ